MQTNEILKRIGLGVLLFSLIVAGGVGLIGTESADQPAVDGQSIDAFDTDDMMTDVPADTGAIELTENAKGDVVVIDTSHGATLTRDQLTPIVETLTDNGAEVRFLTGENGGGDRVQTVIRTSTRVFAKQMPISRSGQNNNTPRVKSMG